MTKLTLTANELEVLNAFLVNSYPTAEELKSDLGSTWMDAKELASEAGRSVASVRGVLGSLVRKGMVQTGEGGGGIPIQCLTETGVDALFAEHRLRRTEAEAAEPEAEAEAAEPEAEAAEPEAEAPAAPAAPAARQKVVLSRIEQFPDAVFTFTGANYRKPGTEGHKALQWLIDQGGSATVAQALAENPRFIRHLLWDLKKTDGMSLS